MATETGILLRRGEFRIKNGPSKFDLQQAFFDAGTPKKHDRRAITLEIDDKYYETTEVIVNLIAWEDGSGDSWILEGFVTIIKGNLTVRGKNKFTCYYSTHNRRGRIEFNSDPDAE